MHQIFLLALAIFSGLPLPLDPIMILWINLVTDGTQDKTFPFIKEEGGVMEKPPVKPGKQFFDREQIIRIVVFGAVMGTVSYLLFVYLLGVTSYIVASSITFVGVVMPQWVNGIQAQKEKEPFLKNIKRSFTINPYIFLGAGIGLVLQLFAIYVVPGWFSMVPLTADQWIYPLGLVVLAFFVIEIRKVIEYYMLKNR
jgi:Ca2+-transporting ATPase